MVGIGSSALQELGFRKRREIQVAFSFANYTGQCYVARSVKSRHRMVTWELTPGRVKSPTSIAAHRFPRGHALPSTFLAQAST